MGGKEGELLGRDCYSVDGLEIHRCSIKSEARGQVFTYLAYMLC